MADDEVPDDNKPKKLFGTETLLDLTLSASQSERVVVAIEEQAKDVHAIFRIHNNPRKTTLRVAVDYILGDRWKFALLVQLLTVLGAMVTGTYLTWDDSGNIQVGGDGGSDADTAFESGYAPESEE